MPNRHEFVKHYGYEKGLQYFGLLVRSHLIAKAKITDEPVLEFWITSYNEDTDTLEKV